MAEQRWVLDAELERGLSELGPYVVYPSTPDLATRVRAQLAQGVPVRRRPWWSFEAGWQRAVTVSVVLVVLVLVGAALALSPGVRDAVADRLGLRGVSIEHVPEALTPQPMASVAPGSAPGAALNLGISATLADARGRIGFGLLVPESLGAPDAVYVRTANEVSLVYGPRPDVPRTTGSASVGLLLSEYQAALDTTLWGKAIPPGARLEQVQVNGARAYFISGAAHTFFYRDQRGQIQDEHSRLAGNTLLWEQHGLTLRIESALDKAAAIRIAESLR